MPSSRQDQLHSYQYSQQRVVSALVTHDPDPSRSPLRRAGSAALVSMLVAAIAVGGVAAYALITGTKKVDPKKENVVFVEKESGAQYIYFGADQRLHPVLNFTSGLLIAGAADKATTSNVTRKSLASVPLGAPMGIPSAPDSLPSAKDLMDEPWTVCSVQDAKVPTSTKSLLVVGEPPTGGRIPSHTAGERGEALLVSDPANTVYLVYGNRRFRFPPEKAQAPLTALGLSDDRPIPVSAAWINAVPRGRDIGPPPIYGWGKPSAIPDVYIGKFFQSSIDGGSTQVYAIAMDDGVADITEVQAKQLLIDDGSGRRMDDIKVLATNTFIGLPRSRTKLTGTDVTDGQPALLPVLLPMTQQVCVTTRHKTDQGGESVVRVDPTVAAGVDVTAKASATSGPRADEVGVPRGRGVLVEAAASAIATPGSSGLSLVLDTGIRYPLASADVPAKLGYGGVKPLQYPSEMVALLPVGPSLDPVEARKARTETD